MIKAVIFDMYETLITQYNSPQYFGRHIAKDAGINETVFMKSWVAIEDNKTVGKMSFEGAIEGILKENNCYSKELVEIISERRKSTKREAFNHLDEQIIPMLEQIKRSGLKIALITNCYSEEVEVIHESKLFSYFDTVCFSYEEGLKKPDKAIYKLCLDRLNLKSDECLYVGDGGSFELEGAERAGITVVQAVWYIKNIPFYKENIDKKFIQVEQPLDVLKYCL